MHTRVPIGPETLVFISKSIFTDKNLSIPVPIVHPPSPKKNSQNQMILVVTVNRTSGLSILSSP